MAEKKQLEFHEHANIFPLMQGEEFDDLVSDVQTEGLHEPIVMYEGKILDGRNRYRACLQAKVSPKFETYKGKKPLQYVISLNLKRRHLNESQRAMVAARIAVIPHGGAGRGRTASAPTQREAALNLKVGRRSVQAAQAVLSLGSANLIKAVDDGHIKIDSAQRLVGLPKEFQERIVTEARDADPEDVPKLIQEASRKIREEDIRVKAKGWDTKSKFSGPYAVIYADPPWGFSNTNVNGSALKKYPAMDVNAICALQIRGRSLQEAALSDAVLFLWVPSALIAEGLQVITAWGFEYKSMLVWVKKKVGEDELQKGTGFWVRNSHELLFIAKRGDFPPPSTGKRPDSVIEAQRGKHSEKPEEFYKLIENLYPKMKRIELFARAKRDGWDRWGLEAN